MSKSSRATLPTNVKPNRYRLTLEPDLEAFTFRGDVAIEIEVVEPSSEITLNAAEIDILSSKLTLDGGQRHQAEGHGPGRVPRDRHLCVRFRDSDRAGHA